MKLSLKAPFRPLIKLVEIIGGIKLKKINLNLVFGGVKRNKIILHLKLYQIICFDKEGKNKSILENAKPKNEKLFKYILSRKYKFLIQKYNEINPKFIIDGERKTIKGFKTIDEVLEHKYRNKRANIRETKIYEIKKMTSDILNDFHGLKGRNPKKNGKLGLDIKAEYIEKFEENQEMFGNFGLNINEEEDEIENSFLNFNFHDNFEIAGDITLVDEKDIPQFDICLAGFPCQAFSIAGTGGAGRGGFNDNFIAISSFG